MNIVFYRYNSICEPDYIDAFTKMGITVVEDRDGSDMGLDIGSKIQKLGNLIAEHHPMFVFSINYFPFLSILCDRLKIMYVAESVDCPVFEIYHNSIKNKTNRLFLFDRKQFLSVKDQNPECIFYLPLGAPVERTSTLLGDSYNPEYDISFVGSLYKEKDSYFELNMAKEQDERFLSMMEMQLAASCSGMAYLEKMLSSVDTDIIKNSAENFYTSDQAVNNMDGFVVLNDYLAPHMAYLERVRILNELGDKIYDAKTHLFTRSDTSKLSKNIAIHGGVKSLEEMPFVFRNSRINLNITLRSIQSGLPQRIWDILSCGGFLMTNEQPEIQDFFISGVHLVTYENMEDLLEKVRYYLEHDDERKKIAMAGYEEVKNKHTVLARVMEIIKVVYATLN